MPYLGGNETNYGRRIQKGDFSLKQDATDIAQSFGKDYFYTKTDQKRSVVNTLPPYYVHKLYLRIFGYG